MSYLLSLKEACKKCLFHYLRSIFIEHIVKQFNSFITLLWKIYENNKCKRCILLSINGEKQVKEQSNCKSGSIFIYYLKKKVKFVKHLN